MLRLGPSAMRAPAGPRIEFTGVSFEWARSMRESSWAEPSASSFWPAARAMFSSARSFRPLRPRRPWTNRDDPFRVGIRGARNWQLRAARPRPALARLRQHHQHPQAGLAGSGRRQAARARSRACPRHSTPTSTAPRSPRCAGARAKGSTISLMSRSAPALASGWSSMASRRAASAIASSVISESLGLPGDAWPGSCPFHGDCVEGLASGPALKARLGIGEASGIVADDPVWDGVAWALAQLCHAIVCAAAPRAIAIGGGVAEGQPHLLERIQRLLVESLNGYVELPSGDYVRAPGLGPEAGPLGAIALAMTARR